MSSESLIAAWKNPIARHGDSASHPAGAVLIDPRPADDLRTRLLCWPPTTQAMDTMTEMYTCTSVTPEL
jgi:hypothetical protein